MRLRTGLAGLMLILPFLFGYTLGPSANMLPLLFGLACAGILLLCSPLGRLRPGSFWALLALPAILLLHASVVAPAYGSWLGSTVLALLLLWLLAQAGAGWLQQGRIAYIWAALLLAAVLSSLICLLQLKGWAQDWSPWIHPGNPARLFGNLRQPNQMASLSAMGFAVLLLYAPYRPIPAVPRWGWQLGLGLALALLALACAGSRSRTGLLQWLGVGLAIAYWSWRGRCPKSSLLWAGLGLLLYSLFAWGLNYDWQALGQGLPVSQLHGGGGEASSALSRLENASQDARTVLWANVWQVAAQRPGLGWGWGNLGLGLLYTPIQGALFGVPLDNAHNLPLHLAAELGWPIALLFCALLALWAWRRHPARASSPEQQIAWLVLAIIGLHSLLEYPLWHAPFWLVTALATGVLASGVQPPAAWRQQRPYWLAFSGLLAWALSLALAWDWLRVSQVYLDHEQRSAVFVSQPDWIKRNSHSFCFAPYADFAQLGLQELTHDNAAQELARALRILPYSSEAKVLRRARDAALLLNDRAQAQHYQQLLARRWPKAAQQEAWSMPPQQP